MSKEITADDGKDVDYALRVVNRIISTVAREVITLANDRPTEVVEAICRERVALAVQVWCALRNTRDVP